MSEPMSAEERARLRVACENTLAGRSVDSHIDPRGVLGLLDDVDRLTGRDVERLIEASSLGTPEAQTARESVPREVGTAIAIAAKYLGRAERAEADLADEKRRRAAEIAAAEQRGREDNTDHGQCYVHGSKALAALIAEARAEGCAGLRAGVEALALSLDRGDSIDRGVATELRALLDTATEETGTL